MKKTKRTCRTKTIKNRFTRGVAKRTRFCWEIFTLPILQPSFGKRNWQRAFCACPLISLTCISLLFLFLTTQHIYIKGWLKVRKSALSWWNDRRKKKKKESKNLKDERKKNDKGQGNELKYSRWVCFPFQSSRYLRKIDEFAFFYFYHRPSLFYS